MPEMLEVERYRTAAATVLDRRITGVDLPDAWFLKGAGADAVRSALVGRRFVAARRIGKLLVLDTDRSARLGLRFGMTGRLIADGVDPVAELEYGSHRDLPAWDRITVRFGPAAVLRLNDPRRLGGVELDPDEAALGPDAWSITAGRLGAAVAGARAPIKACLLDQERLAGVGNLLADETLWRAGIDPARPGGDLDAAEVRRLHRTLRRVLDQLHERGGSHTGDLQAARLRGGRCPKDGTPLARRTIGGRTTFSCPEHQH